MALDAKILNYLRPHSGAVGAPPATGLLQGDAGLIAINFAGNDSKDKIAGTAALYSFDGSAWHHMNEAEPVTTQSIDMTAGTSRAAATIGAAYGALSPALKKLTGSIVVGVWGTPTAGAYLLTDRSHPTVDGAWTPLGSATAIASGGDITAGTNNSKMITPKGLIDYLRSRFAGIPASGSITTPTGGTSPSAGKILLLNAQGMIPASALPFATLPEMKAGTTHDKIVAPKEFLAALAFMLAQTPANLKVGHVAEKVGGTSASSGKLVALNADGKIAASMLSLAGLHFLGSTDMSLTVPTAPAKGFQNGDVYTHTKTGQTVDNAPGPHTDWHFDPDVVHVESGDMAIYDGTKWHHIATAADLTTAMLKTHSNLMSKDGKIIWGDSHAGAVPAAGTVIIDGGDAANAIAQHLTIKASIIECGTF